MSTSNNIIIRCVDSIFLVLFILILAFQSFLYLSSGKYIHKLLHIDLQEQPNKHSRSIPSISQFLEPKKLSKNTLNIAPSL